MLFAARSVWFEVSARWLLFVWVISVWMWYVFGFRTGMKGETRGEMLELSWWYNGCLGCFMQFAQRKQRKGGRMQEQVFHSLFPPSVPLSNSTTDQIFWTVSLIELSCIKTWHEFSGFPANIVTVLIAGFNTKGKIKWEVYPCKVFLSYKILFFFFTVFQELGVLIFFIIYALWIF